MSLLSDSYCSFVNLDSRPDRLVRMQRELERVGIQAERFSGLPWKDLWDNATPEQKHKWGFMHDIRKTPGAIGCHVSQVSIIEKAYFHGKNAFVMEDDLLFCSDFNERMKIVESFLSNNEWDIFWLGGTYHIKPEWHKSINGKHTHPDLQMCNCTLNKDWEPTEDSHIVRTYGCWSTYAYIINYNSIPKILKLLYENIHLSMGIDWLFILLQPQLKTFAFNPGIAKQYDNKSDIGTGITNFSGFQSLGRHWFSDKM